MQDRTNKFFDSLTNYDAESTQGRGSASATMLRSKMQASGAGGLSRGSQLAWGALVSRDTSKWLIDFLVIAATTLLLRIPSISLSVFGSADESAFILSANEVIFGHLPYLTFWDHKPLGSTLILAGAMAAFGSSIEVIRAVAIACATSTAWFLYLIVRHVVPHRAVALTTALLYAAYSVRLSGISAITEIILAPFTAAGIVLLLRTGMQPTAFRQIIMFAVAGLSFGIATWIKYVPAVPAAFTGGFALIALLLERTRRMPVVFACAGTFAVALMLPTVISMAWYWQAGVLDEFIWANFGFMGAYMVGHHDHPKGSLFYAIRWTALVVVQIWPLMLAAMAACLTAGKNSDQRWMGFRTEMVVIVWLFAEFLALAAQMKFYNYHFLPLLLPLCALGAIGIWHWAERLAQPSNVWRLGMLAAVFIGLGPILNHTRDVAAALSKSDVPREIAAIIADTKRPNDQAYVVNYEPIIYFLADTPLPTRFAFPVSLVGPHQATLPIDAKTEVQRILSNKPRFIVLNQSWRDDSGVWWDPEALALIEGALAHDYTRKATWLLPEQRGTVGLFVLKE